MMKYELTDDIIFLGDYKLYRIKALKDFSDIKKGDLGGYIHRLSNLSQYGNCWIYGYGQVYENGRVYGNGQVHGYGRVYGNGQVHGYGQVYGNGQVYENGRVHGYGQVHGDGRVHEYGQVYGNGRVYGNGQVYGYAIIKYGILIKDIFDDMIQYIACSFNVYPINGKYYLYKKVNFWKDNVYRSCYDYNFIYEDGKYAIANEYDNDKLKSYSKGLHVSTPFFWSEGDTLISVTVDIKDIITCMGGKLRVKKLFVNGKIK